MKDKSRIAIVWTLSVQRPVKLEQIILFGHFISQCPENINLTYKECCPDILDWSLTPLCSLIYSETLSSSGEHERSYLRSFSEYSCEAERQRTRSKRVARFDHRVSCPLIGLCSCLSPTTSSINRYRHGRTTFCLSHGKPHDNPLLCSRSYFSDTSPRLCPTSIATVSVAFFILR